MQAENGTSTGEPVPDLLLGEQSLKAVMEEFEAAGNSSATVDHKEYPMTDGAAKLYHEKIATYLDPRTMEEKSVCRRHFLPIEAVWDISQALDRQMTVGDLEHLVGLDGDFQVCHLTEHWFQPVWWVHISLKSRFLGAVHHYKAIGPAREFGAAIVGCFYPKRNVNDLEYVTVSGVPFGLRPNRETGQLETTKSGLRNGSPIFKFHLGMEPNRWGLASKKCSEIIAERRCRLEAKLNPKKVVSFPVGNGRQQATRSGQCPDRRQFRKAH